MVLRKMSFSSVQLVNFEVLFFNLIGVLYSLQFVLTTAFIH